MASVEALPILHDDGSITRSVDWPIDGTSFKCEQHLAPDGTLLDCKITDSIGLKFAEVDFLNGKDLRADFRLYLQSRGFLDRIPN